MCKYGSGTAGGPFGGIITKICFFMYELLYIRHFLRNVPPQ